MKKIVFAVGIFLFATGVWAAPPSATIVYQPMSSEGLAAGYPFEAWVYLDRSPDPAVPGYAFPGSSTFRVTFPEAFTPQTGHAPAAVLLNGWPHGSIEAPFTVGLDSRDPRAELKGGTTYDPSGP